MSIIVELPDLPAVRRHFGPALLLTTDRGAVKAVHTAPEQAEDGALLLRAPGRGSVRNVEANDRVTLVWHPPSEPGFSLIVDGVAGVVEGFGERPDLLVVPTGAVLHRPVTASADSATHPFWISAFLDVAPAHWDAATAFWPAVTGTRLDDLRGASDQYATLRPPAGHAHLKLQRLDAGDSRTHVDLHVPEPGRAAEVAESLGATVLERSPDGFVVLASPAGVVFCLVAHAACLPAPSVLHDDGRTTRADHLCIDVAADHDFEAEVRFWTRLTGRRVAPIESAEFRELPAPAGQPLTLLLQRLETSGASGAHVDLSSSDRAAEVAAHRTLGAELVEERADWTVLLAPDGRRYCVAAHASDAPL